VEIATGLEEMAADIAPGGQRCRNFLFNSCASIKDEVKTSFFKRNNAYFYYFLIKERVHHEKN